MKRTATTLVLLAGLGGGGCVSPAQQAQKGQPAGGGLGTVAGGKEGNTRQGRLGEPVMAVRGAMPAGGNGVMQAGGTLMGNTGAIRPAMGVTPSMVTPADGRVVASVPGAGGNIIRTS